jgi:hypothetical protein
MTGQGGLMCIGYVLVSFSMSCYVNRGVDLRVREGSDRNEIVRTVDVIYYYECSLLIVVPVNQNPYVDCEIPFLRGNMAMVKKT